jgi:hypothetical protein
LYAGERKKERLNLKYLNDKKSYPVSFDIVSSNIVKIVGDFPIKTKGFILTRIGNPDAFTGDYSEYTTVYKEIEGGALFSNDGSIYVEPIPIVNFYTDGRGALDGVVSQEAKTYEELLVPTPIANENYEFAYWSPEIPNSGEIETLNKSFIAIFKSTLPEPEPEPTLEERVIAVEEQNATLTLTVDSILTDVIPALM